MKQAVKARIEARYWCGTDTGLISVSKEGVRSFVLPFAFFFLHFPSKNNAATTLINPLSFVLWISFFALAIGRKKTKQTFTFLWHYFLRSQPAFPQEEYVVILCCRGILIQQRVCTSKRSHQNARSVWSSWNADTQHTYLIPLARIQTSP